jgi:hypothetical protein
MMVFGSSSTSIHRSAMNAVVVHESVYGKTRAIVEDSEGPLEAGEGVTS